MVEYCQTSSYKDEKNLIAKKKISLTDPTFWLHPLPLVC